MCPQANGVGRMAPGFGAGKFNPIHVPNLGFAFIPGVGYTLNAGNVRVWNDQSGNGINIAQADPNRQPVPIASSAAFNNQPALSFVGAGLNAKALNELTFAWNAPRSFVIAFQNNTPGTNGLILSDDSTFLGMYTPPGPSIYFTNGGAQTTGAWAYNTTKIVLVTWEIIAGLGTGKIYVNSKNASDTQNVGNTARTGLRISYPGSNAEMNGIAGEIYGYNKLLSNSEISQIMDYYSNLYNIPLI